MAVDMSKPIGPLPTGAWIVAGVGGLGLVWYSRTHGINSGSSQQQTLTPADQSGTGPGWIAVVPPTTTPNSPTPDQITTNDQWSNSAISWLIAQGVEPSIADAAIRSYINGQDYHNSQYQSVVDMALKHFGPPPQTLTPFTTPPGSNPPPPSNNPPPPPPPVNNPPPPPPPPPAPTPGTTQRIAIVGHWPALDGSLWGLAVMFYGNGNRWPDIYNANRAVIGNNPNLIFPGQRLVIP